MEIEGAVGEKDAMHSPAFCKERAPPKSTCELICLSG